MSSTGQYPTSNTSAGEEDTPTEEDYVSETLKGMNDPDNTYSRKVRRIYYDMFKPWKEVDYRDNVVQTLEILKQHNSISPANLPRAVELLEKRHRMKAITEWFRMVEEKFCRPDWWVMTREDKDDFYSTMYWKRSKMVQMFDEWSRSGEEEKQANREWDFFLQQETRAAAGKMVTGGVHAYDEVTGGPQNWTVASEKLKPFVYCDDRGGELRDTPARTSSNPLSTASEAAARHQQVAPSSIIARKNRRTPDARTGILWDKPEKTPVNGWGNTIGDTNKPVSRVDLENKRKRREQAVPSKAPFTNGTTDHRFTLSEQTVVPTTLHIPLAYTTPAEGDAELSSLQTDPSNLYVIERKIRQFYARACEDTVQFLRALPYIPPSALKEAEAELDTKLASLAIKKKFEWRKEIEWEREKKAEEKRLGRKYPLPGQTILRRYEIPGSAGSPFDQCVVGAFTLEGVRWLPGNTNVEVGARTKKA